MSAQKKYWLKYNDGMECCFKCNSILDIEKFVIENNIKDEQIIEIIEWV